MEQFDARAVMAARIAEECHPERGFGHESHPMVDQPAEPPPPSPSGDAPHGGRGGGSPPPVAAVRSRPS
jgi:hypothetical protein